MGATQCCGRQSVLHNSAKLSPIDHSVYRLTSRNCLTVLNCVKLVIHKATQHLVTLLFSGRARISFRVPSQSPFLEGNPDPLTFLNLVLTLFIVIFFIANDAKQVEILYSLNLCLSSAMSLSMSIIIFSAAKIAETIA